MTDPRQPDAVPQQKPNIETHEGRREIMQRASKGDQAVLTLVGELLDRDHREGGCLMLAYGDAFRHASIELISIAAGNDLLIREALLRKIRTVSEDLAGSDPSPLERILADRIAVCWFDAYEMDRQYADQNSIPVKLASYRDSRRDRAHRRFLAACKTLASVRRLRGPAIQLNVAQQVNLGGTT